MCERDSHSEVGPRSVETERARNAGPFPARGSFPVDARVPFRMQRWIRRGIGRLAERIACRRRLPGSLLPLQRLLNQPFAVSISQLDWGEGVGGVERYQVEEMRSCNANGIHVFQIYPGIVRKRFLSLKWKRRVFGINCDERSLRRQLPIRLLPRVIRLFNRSDQRIAYNIHHLIGWKEPEVRSLIRRIRGRRVFVYAHDMYLCCPSAHFLFDGKEYCGALENAGRSDRCPACLYGDRIARHQRLVRALLDVAERVITPSPVVSRALVGAYPGVVEGKLLFFEHQVAVYAGEKTVQEHGRKRLAFLGASVAHKGWKAFERLARDPDLRRRYDLYHIGEAFSEPVEGVRQVPFSILRQGVHAGIHALLENRIDMVLLLSAVPEAYSYTLHEALAAGIPVLAFRNSGNIAYKILRKKVYGAVFPGEAELRSFLADDGEVLRFLRENTNSFLSSLHMNSALLALVEGGRAPAPESEPAGRGQEASFLTSNT